MTKAQEPYLWICIVPGKWEPENIRAWTRDPDRAAQLTAGGLDMKPLYLAAQPQTSKQRQPGDEVVFFNGHLVTWAEVEAAVQEWKCSHTRPVHGGKS